MKAEENGKCIRWCILGAIGGVSLPRVFLLAGNLVFLLYDWCLTRLIALYMAKWHPRVRKLFHL